MFGFGKSENSESVAKDREASAAALLEKMAAYKPVDRRKISGIRVLSKFALTLPSFDVFNNNRNVQTGCCVVNIRGGCFYFGSPISELKLAKIFPKNKVIEIKKLRFASTENDVRIDIDDLKVTFHSFRPAEGSVGLVMKFVNLTDAQLDSVSRLESDFLHIEKNENWEFVKNYL